MNKLPGIVDALVEQSMRPTGMRADKGYASTANRDYLKGCNPADTCCNRARRKSKTPHQENW